jgi:hypothetical protein
MFWNNNNNSNNRLLSRITALEVEFDALKRRLENLDFDLSQAKKKKRIQPEEPEEEVKIKPYGPILS